MYNEIKTILTMSKDKGVDIGVAADMLANTYPYNVDDELCAGLNDASAFLKDNQVVILKLHNAGMEDKIEELCGLAGDDKAVWKFVDGLYKDGVIER